MAAFEFGFLSPRVLALVCVSLILIDAATGHQIKRRRVGGVSHGMARSASAKGGSDMSADAVYQPLGVESRSGSTMGNFAQKAKSLLRGRYGKRRGGAGINRKVQAAAPQQMATSDNNGKGGMLRGYYGKRSDEDQE